MRGNPYTLVVASHKGGTGRTTVACALAYCWGRAGHSVLLADADPVGSVKLLALGDRGTCAWANVRYLDHLPAPAEARGCEVVVVDGPALLSAAAQPVLARADGLVLTGLADPLTLRTIPVASGAIESARRDNPRLDLVGLLIGVYDPNDPIQAAMLARLRQTHAGLLLEPPIPHQAEVSDWPSASGTGLPPGPAADALEEIAGTLEAWIGLGAAV
jgi:chromosome partitioning protein